MAQVSYRTERAAVLGMTYFDSAIHISQFDARAPARQFSAQVASHKPMTVHMQSEIVIDAAGDRAGFDFGLGIRRNRQFDLAVYRIQFDRRSRKLIETGFQPAIHGGEPGTPGKIASHKLPVDAGGAHFTAHAGPVEGPIDQFDFIEASPARHS